MLVVSREDWRSIGGAAAAGAPEVDSLKPFLASCVRLSSIIHGGSSFTLAPVDGDVTPVPVPAPLRPFMLPWLLLLP